MTRSAITATAFAWDVTCYKRHNDVASLALTLARHAKYDAQYAAAKDEMATLSPPHLRTALYWLEASRDAERRGFWQHIQMGEAFTKIGAPSVIGLFPHDQQLLATKFLEQAPAEAVAA